MRPRTSGFRNCPLLPASRAINQLVFAVGVLVGGSMNTWYLNRVTNAAYCAYRERFLQERARLATSQRAPLDEPVVDAEVDDDDERKAPGA